MRETDARCEAGAGGRAAPRSGPGQDPYEAGAGLEGALEAWGREVGKTGTGRGKIRGWRGGGRMVG